MSTYAGTVAALLVDQVPADSTERALKLLQHMVHAAPENDELASSRRI